MRIAQEIQRKLEELDVKLKTLEAEGVEVEKKLRGEGNKLQNFYFYLFFSIYFIKYNKIVWIVFLCNHYVFVIMVDFILLRRRKK